MHAADTRLADAFAKFNADVEHISFPATLSGYVSELEGDADDVASTLRKLATADAAHRAAILTDYQHAVSQFNDDYVSATAPTGL